MNRIHHWLCRSAHWQKVVEQRVPWVISSANLGEDVLETGPGPGLTTDLLLSRVQRLTAIEADPGVAKALRSRMNGVNVSVVTGDATAMPFPDATFSGCASFTMLHHVPSRDLQDKMLREVRRVLQPGGVFVGSDSLQSVFMRIIHIGDTCVLVNPDTFAARLEAAGFDVLELEKSRDAFRFHARKPIGFQ
jgi:ubiquinone/menaquinone biosynthesis C-methylase UbiE